MNELLLMCRIAGRRAAIPALQVKSVIEVEAITPIPRAPDFIVGLTALRSQALTVVDCRRALGLERMEIVSGTRAAVVEFEGHTYALLVEQAYDVAEAQSEPDVIPGGFGEEWQRVSKGMVETAEGPALLVSVEKLIEGPVAVPVSTAA